MVSEERNVLEALTKGAMDSIPLISSIIVMVITFIAIIAMGDAILSWFVCECACVSPFGIYHFRYMCCGAESPRNRVGFPVEAA